MAPRKKKRQFEIDRDAGLTDEDKAIIQQLGMGQVPDASGALPMPRGFGVGLAGSIPRAPLPPPAPPAPGRSMLPPRTGAPLEDRPLTDEEVASLSGAVDMNVEQRPEAAPLENPVHYGERPPTPRDDQFNALIGDLAGPREVPPMEISPAEVVEFEGRQPPPMPSAQPPQQGGLTDEDVAALSGAADRAQEPPSPPQGEQQMPSWYDELARVPEGPSNSDMNRSWVLSTIGSAMGGGPEGQNLALRRQQLGERAASQNARQGIMANASQDAYRQAMLEEKGQGLSLREQALLLSGQRLGMQREQGDKRIEQADTRLGLSAEEMANKGVRQDKQIENSQSLADKRIEAARVGREAAPGIHAETVRQDPVKRDEARTSYAALHVPLKRAIDSYQYLEKKSPKILDLYVKLGNGGLQGSITNIAASEEDQKAMAQINKLLVEGGWAEGGKNFTNIERSMMGKFVGAPVGEGFNPFQSPKVLKDYLKGLNEVRRLRKQSAETTFGSDVWNQ